MKKPDAEKSKSSDVEIKAEVDELESVNLNEEFISRLKTLPSRPDCNKNDQPAAESKTTFGGGRSSVTDNPTCIRVARQVWPTASNSLIHAWAILDSRNETIFLSDN